MRRLLIISPFAMAVPINWDEVDFAWQGQGNLPPWAVPEVPRYGNTISGGSYARDTRDRLAMVDNLVANDNSFGNTAHYPMRRKLYQNARKYDYKLALMEKKHDHAYNRERLYARGLAEKYSKPPAHPQKRPALFYTYGKFHAQHPGSKPAVHRRNVVRHHEYRFKR